MFNTGTSTTATAVPTQTVGKILVSNNTTINLQSAGVVNLTISGGNSNDLVIATGSTLQINSANAITLAYINSCSADISGTLSLTGAGASNTYNSANSVTTVAGSINNFGIVTSTLSNLIFNSSSNYRHNYTTSPGTIPTATWHVASNCIIQGYTTGGGGNFTPLGLAQSFGNFTWNCTSQSNSAQLAGNLTSVNGNFTITSSGAGAAQVRLSSNTTQTINIGGNFNINGGQLSLSLNNGGSTTVNIGGSYTQTAGVLDFAQGNASSLGKLNISGDFTFTAGTMQQTAAAATGGVGVIEFLGTVAQNVSSSGTYTNAIDIVLNNSNGINLTGTLQINNGASFYRTLGAITGGTVSYNATGTTLVYLLPGSNTAGVEFPSSNGPTNLTINSTGMISLSGSRSLPATGVLTELNGVLSLGAFDLTLNNNAAAAIVNATPSITNMIAADGTGYLMRAIATVARNYVYYIGDLTGTTEYSPISLNFSANSVARIVGTRVSDATSPNMNTPLAPIDFTSRAWYLIENGAGGTYTYKPTLRYLAADVNGTENNFLISSFFSGLWTPYPSTITSPSIVTTNSLTQADFAINGAELTARCPVKYWTGVTSSDWYDGSNWTPAGVPVSTDNIDISFNIPNPCEIGSGSVTINNLTLNGTGALNLLANTTIIINGNLTYVNTATGSFDCSSTFRIANTVFPQTVPPLNYGHLNIVGGARVLSPSGTIGICGNYTPTAGAVTTTNSSVLFNGTSAQSILTNTTSFNHVTVSNTGGNVSSAFNVTMNGTVQINAAARYEQTAGTLTFSASAVANVDGFLKGSNATITNNGSLNFSGTGKYEHSRIGVNPGTIPTATWASGSTCHVMGASNGNQLLNCGQAFHHFIYDNAATANIRTNGLLTTINGDFTILNTGAVAQTFQVGLAAGNIITIKGNYNQSAGILDLVSGGGTTSVRLEGNFTISGTGKIDKSGNTADFNFVKSTGIQTFICTATGINANAIDWNVGNGTTTNTLQLQNNFIMANAAAVSVFNNATLDCGTNIVSTATTNNGNFNLNSGGTLIIGSPNGISTSPTASGNIQTTTSRVFSTGANYIYRASAAQVTGNGLPATVNNLEFDNTSGANPAIVQTSSTTLAGVLSVTNGIVQLGANNITLSGNLGSNLIGGSSTAFLQTNSTGELRRTIATSGFPQVYLYPIGTSTNYTPASYTFNSNSISRTLNIRTVGSTHPQLNSPNPQVDFISNRYWKTDLSTSAGTYVYSSQFTFLPSDINGTVTNINLNRFDNTTLNWTEDAGSSTSGTTISSGILTHISGPLTVTATTVAADWVGRIINGTYIWNGSVSSVYTNGNNWTPAIVGGPLPTDNIVINVPGTNQLNITGNISVYNLTLNAIGALNLAAGSTFTVNGNLTYAGTTSTNFDCSSTFNLTKITSQPVPPINYGNLNVTGGPRVLSAIGTIRVCGNYTPSTSGTTITGSTVEFNGVSAQSIVGGNADFENFRVSNITGTVNSLFNLSISGTGTIDNNASYSQDAGQFNIQASGTTNVSGNLILNGGSINNSGTLNILNNGNLKVTTSPSIAGTAPFYATGSMLTYESSGIYNAGLEWSATIGAGYPHHVTLSNNTTLDLGNGAPAIAKAISGDLLVNDGSQLSMNITPMSADLSVAGDVTVGTAGIATLVLSTLNGGNINVGGDWTRASTSVFTHNNRKVTFNRSTAGNQSINYSGTETFYDIDFAVSAGNVIMNSNVDVLNTISLISGKVNLNNNTLTLGTVANDGTLIGGTATEYVISGNTSSNWVRYTTANSTTYNWPIGDALHYTPIQVTFDASASLLANTQLSVHVVNSPHPNLGTSTNYLKRYWNVTPNNVPANSLYSVQYTWVAGDVVGVEANLFPYKHDNAGWIAAYGSGAVYMMGTGMVNPGTHTTNWSTLFSFSDFTANGNGSPLPISLMLFDAIPVLDQVVINWSTLTETNNDFFTLERSSDAKYFEPIANIDGSGNSNDFKEYSFTDSNPLNGTSYYRLKQTDFDGKFTYSEIDAVNFNSPSLSSMLNISPNPSSNDGFSVIYNQVWEENLVVNLFDISGKLLKHYTLNDLNQQNRIFISTIELDAGIYMLNVINGSNQYNEKVIIRK
ncbi:MAG TPA: T9SS type A sorting domain-containing protein [Bacteroidia bacterium]|nr:T9SS type A sorting domain-containing protein [Bacteroidia bacterium]